MPLRKLQDAASHAGCAGRASDGLGRSRRSFDDLIRPQQQRLGDRQAERFGRLEVDDQFKRDGLFHGQVGGPGPLEDPVHVRGGPPVPVGIAWSIRHEAARVREFSRPAHSREVVPVYKPCNPRGVNPEHRVRQDEERMGALFGYRREDLI
jgi:hypothetical protein